MVGTFACPECGAELELGDLSAGRQARCRCCATLIEVPFLPRVPCPGRSRRRGLRRRAAWSWAVATVGVLLAVLAAALAVRSFGRSAREGHVSALVEEAGRAEASGDFGRALVDLEAALRLAEASPACGPVGLDEVRRRRDAASIREAEARLAELPRIDRGQAVGECLTLLARSDSDPALGPLRGRLHDSLARLAAADLEDARCDLASASPESALTLCERALAATAPLPLGLGGDARDRAWALAAEVVEGFGVVVEPISGDFALGDARWYESELRPLLADGLRRRNYLAMPASSPFRSLWEGRSPLRLGVEVVERQDRRYLDTPHLASRIDCRLALSRRGHRAWGLELTARTPRTVPGLSTYGLGLRVMGTRRDSKVERLLYEGTREALLHQVAGRLLGLPEAGASADAGGPDP